MQQDAPVSRGDIFLRLNRLLLLKDDAAWGLPEAREFVREAQQSLEVAQGWLENLQEQGLPTSRAGYLASLRELIGPPPGPPPNGRTWQDEWEEMTKEWLIKCRCKNTWEAAKALKEESLEMKRSKAKFKDEIRKLQD